MLLERVNSYLNRIPWWRILRKRYQAGSSAHGTSCIDISNHQATLLYATKDPSGKLQVELYKTWSFASDEEFQHTLSDYVHEHKLLGSHCIWLLDQKNYQLLLTEDLPVASQEFQAAIRWKIKNLIAYPVEDAVIDKFPLPIQKTFNPQNMIMAVIARLSYLQPISDQITQSGLDLQVIDIPELGLKNIDATFETDELSTALIYLQAKQGTLIITNKKELYMTRQIDFDIDTLKSNLNDANHYVEKLALQIQRSFDYFQRQWRLASPARVLLAMTKPISLDINALLSTYLATSVNTLNLDDFILNKTEITLKQEYRLLPLIGCLLRKETVVEDVAAN